MGFISGILDSIKDIIKGLGKTLIYIIIAIFIGMWIIAVFIDLWYEANHGSVFISFEATSDVDLSDIKVVAVNLENPNKTYSTKYKEKNEGCALSVKNGIYQIEVVYDNMELALCNSLPLWNGSSYSFSIDPSGMQTSYLIFDVSGENGETIAQDDITIYDESGEQLSLYNMGDGRMLISTFENDFTVLTESREFTVTANGYQSKNVEMDLKNDKAYEIQVILEGE